MAYDLVEGMVILFGGASPTHGHLNDIWAWDGITWKPLHSPVSPQPRVSASMVGANNQILLFGGVSHSGDLLDDTWL